MAYLDRPGRSSGIGFSTYADGTPRVGAFEAPDGAERGHAFEDDWDDEPPGDGDAAPSEASGPPAGSSPVAPRLAVFLAMALAGAVLAFGLAFFGTTMIRSHRQPSIPQPPVGPVATMTPRPVESLPPPRDPEAGIVPQAMAPPAAMAADTVAKPERTVHKAESRRVLAPLNCVRPISMGQRIVCGSPRLLAQDRRMTRAYAEAQAARAPPRTLRRDQLRWLKAREAAARRSRQAVASLYRRRIAELDSRPYGACVASAAPAHSGLAGVTHWLLSVPRRVVRPARTDCG